MRPRMHDRLQGPLHPGSQVLGGNSSPHQEQGSASHQLPLLPQEKGSVHICVSRQKQGKGYLGTDGTGEPKTSGESLISLVNSLPLV